MALIKCRECGKEISDKAVSCPNCGIQLEGAGKSDVSRSDICNEITSVKKKKKTIKKGVLVVLILLVICGCAYGYSYYINYTNAINYCQEICVLLDDADYREAYTKLNGLSQDDFIQCGDMLIERYIEVVCSNKIELERAENGSGKYLGMEDRDFLIWLNIKKIGQRLKELGADDIDDYIAYAEGVVDLKQYLKYDKIIEYTNSLRYESLFDSIMVDTLNETTAFNINYRLNSYDYSGLDMSDEYCVKLCNILENYNDAIVDLYNGLYAGKGYDVAKRGEEKLIEVRQEYADFILEITEINMELRRKFNNLPEI